MCEIGSHLPELVANGGPNVARSSELPASSLPWMVTELEACFVVIDSIGQKVAFVYFAHEAERRSNAKLFSKDEAWRIAANIAKLPELLSQKSFA
jgi:hypothetical protein